MSLEVTIITAAVSNAVGLAPPPFGPIGKAIANFIGTIVNAVGEEQPLRWQDIEPKLTQMINKSIAKAELDSLTNDLQGIRRNLEDYRDNVAQAEKQEVDGIPIDYKALSEQLNQINERLTVRMDKFFNPTGPKGATFPLFGLATAMHLVILEELTHYPNNSVDEMRQLRNRATTYTKVARDTMDELIAARQNLIGDVKTEFLGALPLPGVVVVNFNFFFRDEGLTQDNKVFFSQKSQDQFGPIEEGRDGSVLGPFAQNALQQAQQERDKRMIQVANEFRDGFNALVEPILRAWEPILNPPRVIGQERSTTIWVENHSDHDLILDNTINESNGVFETQDQILAGDLMGKYRSEPATFGALGARLGSKGSLTWKVKKNGQDVGTIRLSFNCSKFTVAVAEARLEITGVPRIVTLQARVGSKYRDWDVAKKIGNVSEVKFKPEEFANPNDTGHPLSLRLIIGAK